LWPDVCLSDLVDSVVKSITKGIVF
jgi:hypothetical protein